MDWDDVLRVINALGCLFGLMLLSTSSYRHWSAWNTKTKSYWWAFFGFVFIGLEGSVESILTDTQPGPRIFIQTIVTVWTIRALLMEGEIFMRPDLPWKKDKIDEDQ